MHYEHEFAKKIGVRYAYSFNSGRVALYALLKVLMIGDEDEVILQVPTHIVVANAIKYLGAIPVYVDCCLDTYNINLELLEKKITKNTKALILQHTFGIPVNLDTALAIANKHGLIVIEDCVHSLGATYEGKQVGSFGLGAIFSTEETKTITTTMGGIAVTNDLKIAEGLEKFQLSCPWPTEEQVIRYLIRFIAYHILTYPYLHYYSRKIYEMLRHPSQASFAPNTATEEEQQGRKPPTYEQRLSNAQSILALRQLNRLDENISHRRLIASLYNDKLIQYGFAVPKPSTKSQPAYVRYPVWVNQPSLTFKYSSNIVQLGEWFDSILLESKSPEYGNYQEGTCTCAEEAIKHLINLPTHSRVKVKDIDDIINSIVISEFSK